MADDFWSEVWRTGRTGFHRDEPHPDLIMYAPDVFAGARRILVPLCGQTPDLEWLAQRYEKIVGIEFVAQAVEQYAGGHGLVETHAVGALRAYRRGGLTLLLGDVFDATPADLGQFDAIWDRAALVALDAATRPRYAATCGDLLRSGGVILQSTFALDQADDVGPPFMVREEELRRLYPHADVDPLTTGDPALRRRLFRIVPSN